MLSGASRNRARESVVRAGHPDSRRPIMAPRNDPPVAGKKRHGGHAFVVAKRQKFAASFRIPHFGRVIDAARENPAPIRGKGNAPDQSGMPIQFEPLLS